MTHDGIQTEPVHYPKRRRRRPLSASQRLVIRDRAILALQRQGWSDADLQAAFGISRFQFHRIREALEQAGRLLERI